MNLYRIPEMLKRGKEWERRERVRVTVRDQKTKNKRERDRDKGREDKRGWVENIKSVM